MWKTSCTSTTTCWLAKWYQTKPSTPSRSGSRTCLSLLGPGSTRAPCVPPTRRHPRHSLLISCKVGAPAGLIKQTHWHRRGFFWGVHFSNLPVYEPYTCVLQKVQALRSFAALRDGLISPRTANGNLMAYRTCLAPQTVKKNSTSTGISSLWLVAPSHP